MREIKGKGIWIWRAQSCKAGDPAGIAAWAEQLGLGHVLIKVVDGTKIYNGPEFVDLPAIIAALQAAGIWVVPWVYTYGANPVAEAAAIAQRLTQLGLTDVVVLDAESEYKVTDGNERAQLLVQELHRLLPTTQLVLSSYRFPASHPTFAWAGFLGGVDAVMPQVYSVLSHDLPAQLQKSFNQYRAITQLPFVPAGPAWTEQGWAPSPAEITGFLEMAQVLLGLDAANFWSWQHLEQLPNLAQAIADYAWEFTPPPPPGEGGDDTGETGGTEMDLDNILAFMRIVKQEQLGSVAITLDLTPLVAPAPSTPGGDGGAADPGTPAGTLHTVTDTKARVFSGPSIGAIGGTDEAIPKGQQVRVGDIQRDSNYYFGQLTECSYNPAWVGRWVRMSDLSE